MKKILFVMFCVSLLAGCSKKNEVMHDSPTFLAVVDSICNKYPDEENVYDVEKVKKGMWDYMNYCTVDQNPIFKDTPLTLGEIYVTIGKDGSKWLLLPLEYTFSEPTETGKRIYQLFVMAHSVYGPNDSVPLKEGERYYVSSSKGVNYLDRMLDIVGVQETIGGGVVDSRSFGTISIEDAKLIPVE